MARIFLDPGHGGTETGAVNKYTLEKNINLVVALEAKRILELNQQTVGISRTTDATINLTTRCNMAKDFKADLLVSIHHNANNGVSKDGEIYHSIVGGIGKNMAEAIATEFRAIGQPTKLLTRESTKYPGKDYYTMIGTPEMPAIITEFGYMDNAADFIQFDEESELLKEGYAIAAGLLKHLGITTIVTQTVETHKHWAEEPYAFCISKGMKIHEKRFDDNITRGEAVALAAQILGLMK
jgi:N-acetylmuramoyl-L-alanine amidase